MSEKDTIDFKQNEPNTIETLVRDFESIGIKKGMSLLVHSSLSSIGWVCGSSVSVIYALEHVLTKKGTLVMPTHSSDLSDPGKWVNPPVPESWWNIIREQMPVFNSELTPTREMGIIAETFRKQKSVVRSSHPNSSFAAWGKDKEYIIQDNHLDYQMNEKSHLGRLYELDGYVLLLGVDYNRNTSMHLSEYKATYKTKNITHEYAPIIENGIRVWKGYEDINFNDDDFIDIGKAFEKDNDVRIGRVGQAKSRLMSQRKIVDYAVKWIEKNRN
jgi:aminoglycoside 3-N-acetyltransferase